MAKRTYDQRLRKATGQEPYQVTVVEDGDQEPFDGENSRNIETIFVKPKKKRPNFASRAS
jgi:hypothetical protein